MVIHEDYAKFKQSEKPSEYCKRKYGYRKNKGKFTEFFFEIEKLLQAIKFYDSTKRTEYTLQDILRT